MVSLASLWLPILLSAVAVFVASSIIHMMLGYHRTDYGPLSNEDEVMDALRRSAASPGEYVVPHAKDTSMLKDPAYQEKAKKGPVAFITIMGPWSPSMGKQLTQWFVYAVVVAIFAAYVASRALGPGAEYLEVFRFVGTTTFIAYAVGLWQTSIWYGKPWGTTMKNTLDGLIYALLSAGFFGWLWPGM